jgi:23S rRNA (cytidine1920-2'-O)/16S rRNA (cytidine1409-2'-O)-methyltransferase
VCIRGSILVFDGLGPEMKANQRIDLLLVERGLAQSREKAQAMILAGEVLADEQKIDKPGHRVRSEAAIRLLGVAPKFVSRGGLKLEAALDGFGIDVAGRICADIGASTGGFTDCLLQRGARKVYAIDVGAGQLHWNIRQDERVVVKERVNARHLTREILPEPIEFACCDVSFISVTLIVPALTRLLRPEADLVVLVKPQFEVGKGQVGKGGIVREPELHRAAVEKVRVSLEQAGFSRIVERESPILGAEGNREFLLHAWGLDPGKTPTA